MHNRLFPLDVHQLDNAPKTDLKTPKNKYKIRYPRGGENEIR